MNMITIKMVVFVIRDLTLNRPGFLQIGMAGGGGGGERFCPLCNFCLNGPIDLKFGM